jgi:hypothetical protein
MTQTLDRRTFIGAVAAGMLAAPLVAKAQTAGSGSLVNPSFEVPLQNGGFTYKPTGSGIGWTFSPNSGIAGNGSRFNNGSAPDGTQVGFIQGASTITQTLSLNAGSYTLSFQASSRWGVPQPIKVTIDGTQIGSLISPASTSFTAVSIPFSVATTGAHTLTFTGTENADKTTFIDAIQLGTGTLPPPPPPVDEPFATGSVGLLNVAQGDWSLAGGSGSQTGLGANGAFAWGQGAVANGGGAIAFGRGANSMYTDTFVVGQGCRADSDNGRAAGWVCHSYGDQGFAHGYQASDRGIDGLEAYAHGSFGTGTEDLGSATAQTARAVLRAQTNNATPTALTTDGRPFSFNNQMRLPDKSSFVLQWLVVARDIANGDSRAWRVLAMATRGVGAGSTTVFPPVITDISTSLGATGWRLSLTADTYNGAVQLNGIGAAGRPIQWVAAMIDGENVG